MPISTNQRAFLEKSIGRAFNDRPMKITADTKVLLSFGGRNNGFEYTDALRKAIMARKGWDNPYSVYLDAESAKGHVASYYSSATNDNGVHMFRNPIWYSLYSAAMSYAKAMVFIVTQAWVASDYCQEEFQWWSERSDLPVIVLMFQDAAGHKREIGRAHV